MRRSVLEQGQTRKAKTRLGMLQHAEQVRHNVSQTCRSFGVRQSLLSGCNVFR